MTLCSNSSHKPIQTFCLIGPPKKSLKKTPPGTRPPNLPRRERLVEPPPSSVAIEGAGVSAVLAAEDLGEGLGRRLRVPGRALEMRLQDPLGLVVVEKVGPVLVALVDQELVSLLVEHRPAVLDEVLRGKRRLPLDGVHELREEVLVLGCLDHLLAVEPAEESLLGVGHFDERTPGSLDTELDAQVAQADPGRLVLECVDRLEVLLDDLEDVRLQLLQPRLRPRPLAERLVARVLGAGGKAPETDKL